MDAKLIHENINNVIKETNLVNLGDKKTGKVRDIYIQDDKLVLVSTDRHSSFDRIIAHIPFKGQILTQFSRWWFEKTKDIIQNHVLDNPDPNVIVAKKCKLVPLEMVCRGYITGSTGTSLWTLYQKGERDFGSFVLPDGLSKNSRLETPVLTPTTKSDAHDMPITGPDAVKQGLLDQKTWDIMSKKTLELFRRGQELALTRGLILVDTKYEFGLTPDGEVMLIDEIHTPDSSRYWQADTYQERINQGLEPENFDKEFLRLWFKENCDPYNDPVLPAAPADMVVELSRRYIQIFEQMTGEKFEINLKENFTERINNNLKKYNI